MQFLRLMKIVTTEQMQRIEARSERAGVSTDTLMERAGLEVARRVRRHLGPLTGIPIVVLVGPGNNGGDGLVAARHLHQWGARPIAYLALGRREPDPKLVSTRDAGVPVLRASDDPGLVKLKSALGSAHMVVDSVLGTGRSRPIEGALKAVMSELAEMRSRRRDLRVLALDLPTGLDADTGAVDPVCPAADVTVALGYPKAGIFAFPGAGLIGMLDVADIGVPAGLDGDVSVQLMTPAWAGALLPDRPASAHKGTFGRTLVIAGSRSYIGAASLAATAAGRAGAGLVTVAVPESMVAAVAARAAEPTYLPLPESSPGVVSDEAGTLVLDNMDTYDVLLVGCGIGQEPATRSLVEGLLYSDRPRPPTVVDADGLNILAMTPDWWDRFRSDAALTPHPGEMARLTGEKLGAQLQRDRVAAARESAARWSKTVVLKGAHTMVAAPDGQAMVSPFANPGLASAGTGDVLAGTIAGLLSQGLGMDDAAALGVYVHGASGERVRDDLGDAGILASDLLPHIPRVIRDLKAVPFRRPMTINRAMTAEAARWPI